MSDSSSQRTPEAIAAFRARLMEGLRMSIVEQGYRATTVADIVRHARASRRTFYEVFETKDDCLVALMYEINAVLGDELEAGVDSDLPWQQQVRRAVEIYLRSAAAEPEVTLSSINELSYLGERSLSTIADFNDQFARIIADLTDNDQFRAAGIEPAPREVSLLVYGGIRHLVADMISHGRDPMQACDLVVESVEAMLWAG